MKKRFVVLVVCVAVILLALQITVPIIETKYADKCGKELTWELDDEQVLTISGKGEMFDYNVFRNRGWKEDGYYGGPYKLIIKDGVTSIGAKALKNCFILGETEISDSVTLIGEDAFSGCWFMKTIEISANVTEIGERAFYNCYSLEEIKVSQDNPNYSNDELGALFSKDGSELICYPAGLCDRTYYQVPESVTSVADYAFYDGNGLVPMCKLRFKGDAPSFGKKAFKDEEVTILYPAENETWEDVITEDFGGEITWVPYYG